MSVLETVETLGTVETAADSKRDASPQPLVVLGLHATTTAVSMVEWAAQEAIARGAALQIVVCSAATCLTVTSSTVTCQDGDGRSLTDAVAATRERHPMLSIEETAIRLDTQNTLVDRAATADLLIVGESHFGTSTRRLLGATSGATRRRRSCPVIALRGQQRQPLRRIAVGIDNSNAAATALDWAADEADRQDAELTIIHAWHRTGKADQGEQSLRSVDHDRGEARRILDDAVNRCTTRMGRAVSCELVDGRPAAALAVASMSADLIAVGSRGSSGFKTMLFGSVAHFLLENAGCPVAVIHPRVRAA